jgi:DNA modification methylase
MSVNADWFVDPYFDDPELDSLDGGTTDHGPLWHAISPRWGHSMHSMCSYHGMFPARLVHYFLQRYTEPGDLVIDPFGGRGTTSLQARVETRRSISNDLSPLGYVLSAAKSNPPSWDAMMKYLTRLERNYKGKAQGDIDVSSEIRMLFHDASLRQMMYLREHLLSSSITSWNPERLMLAGSMAGILHGAQRNDGTSMYLSISMPNTFSMPPAYVKKYIAENNLQKIKQDVFECLRDKLARIYLDSTEGPAGMVFNTDASGLLNGPSLTAGSADLIITSPPYLKVVNYGTSNWIRLWWLGIDNVSRHGGAGRKSLDAKLDHRHTYESYKAFMVRALKGAKRALKRDGVAVFVIGDVAMPGQSALDLAHQIWQDVGERTGLELLDTIEDSLPAQNKVSRIWGDTKGKATDRDCILVLGRQGGLPTEIVGDIDWGEPYKDGGPDAAHDRGRRHRLAS